jgi:hypothetical protein
MVSNALLNNKLFKIAIEAVPISAGAAAAVVHAYWNSKGYDIWQDKLTPQALQETALILTGSSVEQLSVLGKNFLKMVVSILQ